MQASWNPTPTVEELANRVCGTHRAGTLVFELVSTLLRSSLSIIPASLGAVWTSCSPDPPELVASRSASERRRSCAASSLCPELPPLRALAPPCSRACPPGVCAAVLSALSALSAPVCQ
eukprot:3600513-Pleurochrysis_carterae.AAC.1